MNGSTFSIPGLAHYGKSILAIGTPPKGKPSTPPKPLPVVR